MSVGGDRLQSTGGAAPSYALTLGTIAESVSITAISWQGFAAGTNPAGESNPAIELTAPGSAASLALVHAQADAEVIPNATITGVRGANTPAFISLKLADVRVVSFRLDAAAGIEPVIHFVLTAKEIQFAYGAGTAVTVDTWSATT